MRLLSDGTEHRHERLKDWHVRLAAHAFAMKYGQIAPEAYALEVERWHMLMRGEVCCILQNSSEAAKAVTRSGTGITKCVSSEASPAFSKLAIVAQRWLARPPLEVTSLTLARFEAQAEDVLLKALESSELMRRDWREWQHPRDEDGRFKQTGGALGSILDSAKTYQIREHDNVTDEEAELPDYSALLTEIAADVARMKSQGALPEEIFKAQSDKIRWAKRELAIVFESDGNLRFTKQGERSTIDFSQDDLKSMRGAVLIHNHPSARKFKNEKLKKYGASFTDSDIKIAIGCEMQEIRAVTAHQTFSARIVHERFKTAEDSVTFISKVRSDIRSVHADLVKKGLTQTNADWLARHEVWKSAAKKGILEYSVEDESWPKPSSTKK